MEEPINPTEVGKERTNACSQNISGLVEAKKIKGDAQKVLEEKNQRYQKEKLEERYLVEV